MLACATRAQMEVIAEQVARVEAKVIDASRHVGDGSKVSDGVGWMFAAFVTLALLVLVLAYLRKAHQRDMLEGQVDGLKRKVGDPCSDT